MSNCSSTVTTACSLFAQINTPLVLSSGTQKSRQSISAIAAANDALSGATTVLITADDTEGEAALRNNRESQKPFVQDVVYQFGAGADSFIQQEQPAQTGVFLPKDALPFDHPETPFDKLNTYQWPDAVSMGLLGNISAAFVMLTAGGQSCAYHIASGDTMSKEGFKQYCAEHHGGNVTLEWVTIATEDVPAARMEKKAPIGDYWWDHKLPGRRVVRRIVMEPTSKTAELDAVDNPGVFNLWHVRKQSMAVPDGHSTANDIAKLANHLMYLSGGDVVGVTFFLCWLAQLWKTPEIKMPTAMLLYSKYSRVGKNLMQRLISKTFGQPLVASCTGKMLQKNFDDAIEHKRIIFINELARSDKADGYENFKSQVSEEFTQFEGKGRASKEIRNIAHYVITTNHEDALPLMEKDGRIAVLRCLEDRKDDAYYTELVAWIDGPGAPALAQILATWKFPADWDAYAPVPQTAAAQAMQKAARGDLVCTLEDLIREWARPFDKDCGRVMAMVAQLDTAHAAALRGIKVNHKSMPAALERLGAVQIGSGTAAKDSAWFWRNQDYWRGVPTAALLAYIHFGTKPPDYPKTEVSDHE